MQKGTWRRQAPLTWARQQPSEKAAAKKRALTTRSTGQNTSPSNNRMAYAYMLGLSGSLPQGGGYDRQHVVWHLERYVLFLNVVQFQAFQMIVYFAKGEPVNVEYCKVFLWSCNIWVLRTRKLPDAKFFIHSILRTRPNQHANQVKSLNHEYLSY